MSRRPPIRNRAAGTSWQSILGDLSYAVAVERLGPWLTERVFWRLDTEEKVVALTFDDGPNARFTPRLLDVLADHRVRATFFLIGQHLEEHPSAARDAVAAGHEIGNHTYSHPSLIFLANDEIAAEIGRTDATIRELLGVQPQLVRPPMGLFTKRVVRLIEGMGYRTIVGDVYPRDPHEPGRDKIVERVLARVRPGSIIILHDGGNAEHFDRSDTVEAVAAIVPRLLDRGYRFVCVSELLAATTTDHKDYEK
jgi:peptidoglycan/xylan/chitin deacetylase (PgdA/CDA1 family)